MNIEYHPLFQTDLEQAARYYLKNGGRELAEDFIYEVEQAINRIAANPLASSIVLKDVRRLRLKRFDSYAVRFSFDQATETIFVGSLIHGARDPATGQDRFA